MVNLGQKDFQVAQGKFMGDRNWAHFGHQACGDQNFSVTTRLAMECFWSPQAWQLKEFHR
jgi:hypothetical protein